VHHQIQDGGNCCWKNVGKLIPAAGLFCLSIKHLKTNKKNAIFVVSTKIYLPPLAHMHPDIHKLVIILHPDIHKLVIS
jgi:hypothetical protein